MNQNSLLSRGLAGAAAGVAGTLAMYPLRMGAARWLPETTAPVREEPGKFVLERAAQHLHRGTSRLRHRRGRRSSCAA